jgi:hypothetical protein
MLGFLIKLSRSPDEDQPNTKLNHAKDPLEVPSGAITKARAKEV